MAMKTKLMCLVLLSESIDAIFVTKQQQFTRVLYVPSQNRSSYMLSSNHNTPSVVLCGARCEKNGGFSFSYSSSDKKCDTFSRVIVEEGTAPVSGQIMYYSLSFSSCADVPPSSPSGVYTIKISEGTYMEVFCDMDSDNGPWTVIQRRKQPGGLKFLRTWMEYANGFGDLQVEFWIGNDNLHVLAKTPRVLRVELEAWDETKGYAEYSSFKVNDKNDNYRLYVGGFSGNVSNNALSHSNDQPFSTYDRNNDEAPGDITNCGDTHSSGWWFRQCTGANLNGHHQSDSELDEISAIFWWYFPYGTRLNTPLKGTMMMIR